MSNASITSASRPQLEDVHGRKRSFGRMFNRIRIALRRREVDCSKEDTTSIYTTTSSVLQDCELRTEVVVRRAQVHAQPSSLFQVDDEDNIQGSGPQAIVPLQCLGRDDTGIKETTTKQFFVQHGLTYHAHEQRQHMEPAVKQRRVEKAVRMRVRWTCHSCRTIFGADKYCTGCGHRRCFECHRDPARRTRIDDPVDFSNTASISFQQAAGAAPEKAIKNFIEEVHSASLPQAPDKQEAWRCTIQVGRPRADSHLIIASTPAQATQHCHECERPMALAQQTHRNHCQHELCEQSPMLSRTTAPKTVPVVERVFKKPRQRVRYNCEHCDLQFASRHECAGCGHERCDNCPRYPPRKPPTIDIPIEALQAKLITVSGPSTSKAVANTIDSLTPQDALARL